MKSQQTPLESLQGELRQQLEHSQNVINELEAKLSSENEIQANLKVFNSTLIVNIKSLVLQFLFSYDSCD